MSERLLRFPDLKARGIINNWPTLRRWIERENFPVGFRIQNTRFWTEQSINDWIASRAREAA